MERLSETTMTSLQTFASGRYLVVALYVVQVYELIVSAEWEYDLVYKNKHWTSVRVAYILCRYYPLLTWPIFIWSFVLDHDRVACKHYVEPLYLFLFPLQLFAQVVFIIRAWAFTGRRKPTLYALCAAYLLLLGLQIWSVTAGVHSGVDIAIHAIVGNAGCFHGAAGHDSKFLGVRTGLLFVAAFAVDFLCIIVTWLHCLRREQYHGKLARYFLFQGFGGFVILAFVNIVAAILSFHNTVLLSGAVILPVPLVISNVIACRLILGLRRQTRSNAVHIDAMPRIAQNTRLWLVPEDDQWGYDPKAHQAFPRGGSHTTDPGRGDTL